MGTDILIRANWCIDFKEKKIIADSTVPEHYDFMLEYNVKDNLYYADLEIGNLRHRHDRAADMHGMRIQRLSEFHKTF